MRVRGWCLHVAPSAEVSHISVLVFGSRVSGITDYSIYLSRFAVWPNPCHCQDYDRHQGCGVGGWCLDVAAFAEVTHVPFSISVFGSRVSGINDTRNFGYHRYPVSGSRCWGWCLDVASLAEVTHVPLSVPVFGSQISDITDTVCGTV